MTSIPFRSLKGFSSLFCDFIDKKEFILSRFPHHDHNTQSEEELLHAASQFSRTNLSAAMNLTMSHADITEKQKNNLTFMQSGNSLAIVTGQQVGFLGGPLYTFYKIATAISVAESLTSQHKNLNFVPVFWIEDNDHDKQEAATAFLSDKTGQPTQFMCPSDEKNPTNTTVSSLTLSDSISTVLNAIEEQLPESDFAKEFINSLRQSYTIGAEWSTSFIGLLQKWFGNKGLLFIRSSDARRSGSFKDIILRELSSPDMTLSAVLKANELLLRNGYQPQAKPSSVNLFYHSGMVRTKITTDNGIYSAGDTKWTKAELTQEATDFPERFSPNVLLRSLCQDSLLPTYAYIAGPGEIAYLAQLAECYEQFGIRMPMIMPRHSATFLFANHQRLLEKSDKTLEFYLRPIAEIEQDLSADLDDGVLASLQTETNEAITKALHPIGEFAKQTDASLTGSFGSTQKAVQDSVETLLKKIKAAQKRQQQTVFDRTRTLTSFLFPEAKLQERVYGIGALLTKTTEQSFFEALDLLTSMPTDKHYIITITH